MENKITGNKTAFPSIKSEWDNHTAQYIQNATPGMTLRQYYAGCALQGLSHSMAYTKFFHKPELLAEEAVKIADALIAALNKPSTHD